MFKNYLKTTLRFLKQNKLFAGINVLGLSLALAASFIILLYIINEISYNRGYENRKQIYRIVNNYLEFKNTMAGTPYVLASALKDEFPQVEYATRAQFMRGFSLKQNEEFIPVRQAVATDSEIFDIFSLKLTGSKNNILDDPNSIVLSQKQAEKFFPDEDPIGKEIIGLANGKEQLFVVKGVFENIPINSTLRADCFINSRWTLEPINQAFRVTNADVNWDLDFWTTWVMLKQNVDPLTLDPQFRELEVKNMGEKPAKKYVLQNLSDVYLRSAEVMNSGVQGNMKNIRIFSAIAFLIILVAAFNYIILSTAVSSGRAKEIGIRKTNGAEIRSIKTQLLFESIFLAFHVLPLAVLLAWAGKPYAEKLFQTRLYIIDSNIVVYILIYLLLTIVIGFASGFYTSSYLSRLNVINILKNTAASGKRKSVLRFSLIVIQLIIFCSFITGTLVIRSQYKFALKKDLGYQNKNILLFELGRNFREYRAFIDEIKTIPNVTMAAGTMHSIPMLGSMTMMVPNFEDQTQKIKVDGMAVDYNFTETMGLNIIEGRSFSEEFGSDLNGATILNETAVKDLGIEDPVGKQVAGKTIIGIVKDFNLHSIHSDIPPTMLTMTDKYIQQVAINYVPGTLENLLPTLESKWKEMAPDRTFQYQTIEDLIENIYSSEKNLSIIISIFAIFSLFIAAFGLFGLTLFIARTRTKEIGIKKVLGSGEKTIVYSFLKENFFMVLIATLLAIPVTFYFMNRWLSNFSYKVSINFWFFVVAFIIASIVVLFTVLFHSYRASRINPVEALKYE
ncbi:FtsX-like permease family protein [Maribellus comscasis]|uniref:FtsX-like permease family protein n=1 Tax=Maribellus comscasis TaxID=2681766 RepID=A0A6I6JQD3_9BACT|nr:ABC transporter permease [Maribellus comscasis]QGY44621.1 FtsX-like permease family protein [Maribellus comscasis]